MSELKQYALANGISSQTIHDTVSAPRLTSTGYASAWALTHFLAQKRPNEFLTFMQDVSQRKPLEQFTRQEDEELFTRHFKLPYDQMSALLFTHLKSLPFVDPLAQPRIIIVPKKTSGS